LTRFTAPSTVFFIETKVELQSVTRTGCRVARKTQPCRPLAAICSKLA
jgi:hypothetical protein